VYRKLKKKKKLKLNKQKNTGSNISERCRVRKLLRCARRIKIDRLGEAGLPSLPQTVSLQGKAHKVSF